MVRFDSVELNIENDRVILNIGYHEDHTLEFSWGLIENHASPRFFRTDVTDLVLASAKNYKDAKKMEDTEANLNDALENYLEAIDIHFKSLNKEEEHEDIDESFYVIKTKVGGFDWSTLTQNKDSLRIKMLERYSVAELNNGEATIEDFKISKQVN